MDVTYTEWIGKCKIYFQKYIYTLRRLIKFNHDSPFLFTVKCIMFSNKGMGNINGVPEKKWQFCAILLL